MKYKSKWSKKPRATPWANLNSLNLPLPDSVFKRNLQLDWHCHVEICPLKKGISTKPGLPGSNDNPTGLKRTVESCKRLTTVSDRIRKINWGQNRKYLCITVWIHAVPTSGIVHTVLVWENEKRYRERQQQLYFLLSEHGRWCTSGTEIPTVMWLNL